VWWVVLIEIHIVITMPRNLHISGTLYLLPENKSTKRRSRFQHIVMCERQASRARACEGIVDALLNGLIS